MRCKSMAFAIVAACSMLTATLAEIAAAEEQWGDLMGEFIYDGEPPTANMIAVNLPGVAPFPDESLIVDKKTGAIANVVVHLQATANKPVRPIHPDYEEVALANPDAILNVLATGFDPHILLMRNTQSIVVKNKTAFGVDVKIDSIRNQSKNLALAAGQSDFFNLEAEPFPLKVGSNIQPWYGGYVVVQDHPYMAKSGKDGRFEIKNLPVGTWTFHIGTRSREICKWSNEVAKKRSG